MARKYSIRKCLHCGEEKKIAGRGLCWSCYDKCVTNPMKQGKEPEYPIISEAPTLMYNKGSEIATAAPAPKQLFDLRPLVPEEIFWAHACWLAEKMPVKLDNIPAMNKDLKTLADYDPRLRLSGVGEGYDFLKKLSLLVFGREHELVTYFELQQKSVELLEKLRETNTEIDLMLAWAKSVEHEHLEVQVDCESSDLTERSVELTPAN